MKGRQNSVPCDRKSVVSMHNLIICLEILLRTMSQGENIITFVQRRLLRATTFHVSVVQSRSKRYWAVEEGRTQFGHLAFGLFVAAVFKICITSV